MWIERILPPALHPYAYLMRLDRPIGIWLLLLPGLWGITLAAGGAVNFTGETMRIMVLFAFGAVIMRGAGCVINDLWDRDLDKMVERTRSRPLASGAVSVKHGAVFLATLLLLGLIILLQFNMATILLGFLSLPFIALYPLMKRITYWPQVFLGLTFNFSLLMGWCAVTGSLGLQPVFLYIGAILWTIGYDTIYAHQDKEDDLMAGIKSTALLFGAKSKDMVRLFYGLGAAFMVFGFFAELGDMSANPFLPFLAIILLMVAMVYMIRILQKWQPESQSSSLRTFKANYIFGILIWLAALAI